MSSMKATRGFTVMEMMVVLAIIGLMATVGLAALQYARVNARDTVRVNDLQSIARALVAHRIEHGNWVEDGYAVWRGNGFFNIQGNNGEPSVAERLVEAGLLPEEIVDPLGGRGVGVDVGHTGYMKYHCPVSPERTTDVYLYARLEGEPLTETATDGTCCPACDTLYGMNYYQHIDAN